MYKTKIAKDAAEGIKYLKKRRKPLADTQETEEDLLFPKREGVASQRDPSMLQSPEKSRLELAHAGEKATFFQHHKTGHQPS